MPTYVVLFNWTEQGIKNYKDSPGRVDSASAEMAKSGVQIRDIYWTLGPHDLVAIFEARDEEALTAALLELGAAGNVRSTTLRAFSRDDFTRLAGGGS
jgi:uncharacterized protein with GYD domain